MCTTMRAAIMRHLTLALLVASTLGIQGCAAIALSVIGGGAGVAAGTATGYTLDGIAYRTFTASIERVHRATLTTFRRMDITVVTNEEQPEPAGRKIVAQAGDWTVHLELQKLTTKTTRIRVTAKQGVFWRDRATAGEIIAQVEHSLDELAAVSKTTRGR